MCLMAIDRGIVTLMRSCFLYLYLCFGVSRLATPNIMLNSVLEIICVWIGVTWFIVAGRTGREVVKCLGRGLGSGTVHIAGAVKHWFVRLAWLVSHNRRPEAFWRFRFNNRMTGPSPVARYDQTITCGQTPKNAYNTVDVPSPPVPEKMMPSPVYAATPPPLDIRKGGKRLSIKHQTSGGKNLKRGDTVQEKPWRGGYSSLE